MTNHPNRKVLNVRNEADVAYLINRGFDFAVVASRGDRKGRVISTHKSRAAAERAARDTDYTIVDVQPNLHWQF